MLLRLLLLLCCGLAAAAARAEALSDLDDGGTATVTAAIDGDTVLLEDGRTVRLAGILAPKPAPARSGARAASRLADEARATLGALAAGRWVTLRYGGARIDRHRRAVAHLVRDDGLWVQGELLARGLARVLTLPDNRAAAAEMYAIEAAARDSGRGLWGDPRYAVLTPEEAARHVDSLQIVEGQIVAAAETRDRIYLNFGPDWRTDFTVAIEADDRRSFADAGIDLLALGGKTIRVRGWVVWRNGPMIRLTHPEQMERP